MTRRRRWTTELVLGLYAMAWMAPIPPLPIERLRAYLLTERRPVRDCDGQPAARMSLCTTS